MKYLMTMLLLFALAIVGCGRDAQVNALQAQNLKSYKLSRMSFWGCGDDDSRFWSATFTGITQNNTEVKGRVCCGMFKGCAVRY